MRTISKGHCRRKGSHFVAPPTARNYAAAGSTPMSAMDDASDQETQRDSERAGRFDQRVNTRRRMGPRHDGACRRLTAPGVPIDIDLLHSSKGKPPELARLQRSNRTVDANPRGKRDIETCECARA